MTDHIAEPSKLPAKDVALDARGGIRKDMPSSAYKLGEEFKPFHPSASHVRPEWRDGWNACFVAAIAALEAEPQGWRPISEAPKDGTRIILTNGNTVAEGEWLHVEPFVKEVRDGEGRYIDQIENEGHDDWIDCIGGMLPPPTHWMPLPPPPKD